MDGWDEWMGLFFLDGNGNLKKKKKVFYTPPGCVVVSLL